MSLEPINRPKGAEVPFLRVRGGSRAVMERMGKIDHKGLPADLPQQDKGVGLHERKIWEDDWESRIRE